MHVQAFHSRQESVLPKVTVSLNFPFSTSFSISAAGWLRVPWLEILHFIGGEGLHRSVPGGCPCSSGRGDRLERAKVSRAWLCLAMLREALRPEINFWLRHEFQDSPTCEISGRILRF